MQDTQLLVIGDSHADFWNGTSHCLGADTIPGVRSHAIHGALAYNLVEENSTTDSGPLAWGSILSAVAEGFQGWIMLSFGTIDCEVHIWRHAAHVGIVAAVQHTVDRYVEFIAQVKHLHARVAVWAPNAARITIASEPIVGTEAERNLTISLFTKLLKDRLSDIRVPVLSIHEAFVDEEGKTKTDLYWDYTHASQALMPHALRLVNRVLGLQLQQNEYGFPFKEMQVKIFSKVDFVEIQKKRWLMFVIPEGAQFISDITISHTKFSQANTLTVLTSMTEDYLVEQMIGSAHTISNNSRSVKEVAVLSIQRHARVILVHGTFVPIAPDDLKIYIRASEIMQLATNGKPYSRESIRAVVEEITPPATSSRIDTATDSFWGNTNFATPLHY
jgi:lysophospholipase L1-like esterase